VERPDGSGLFDLPADSALRPLGERDWGASPPGAGGSTVLAYAPPPPASTGWLTVKTLGASPATSYLHTWLTGSLEGATAVRHVVLRSGVSTLMIQPDGRGIHVAVTGVDAGPAQNIVDDVVGSLTLTPVDELAAQAASRDPLIASVAFRDAVVELRGYPALFETLRLCELPAPTPTSATATCRSVVSRHLATTGASIDIASYLDAAGTWHLVATTTDFGVDLAAGVDEDVTEHIHDADRQWMRITPPPPVDALEVLGETFRRPTANNADGTLPATTVAPPTR